MSAVRAAIRLAGKKNLLVFPAASRPSINIRISLFPKIFPVISNAVSLSVSGLGHTTYPSLYSIVRPFSLIAVPIMQDHKCRTRGVCLWRLTEFRGCKSSDDSDVRCW